MTDSLPSPREIAAALERKVFGQQTAVREIAVAISKKLAGLPAGNVLLIGASGSGKTTVMRAVESFLASDPKLAQRSTQIRVHANILAQEADEGAPGERLLHRLMARAQEQLGAGASVAGLLDRVAHGIVFVDEVDKIRARIGEDPHVPGIRAQEALLTIMENERLPLELPSSTGGGRAFLDTRGILFVAAGAFEGLYDAVYDRVTVGQDRGALQSVTVLGAEDVREETPFSLRDWLRSQDLFDYGMSPQFLSRFDGVVLLEDLNEGDLLKIFLGAPDSGLQNAKQFFAQFGIELVLSPEAAREIAARAAGQPRLGARALKEVFRRVIRDYEFEPTERAKDGALVVDLAEVTEALART
ncbi:MAG: AAA domain-containing protein [bacterium]|nr:AAA domain-containing protein [bacterium]